MLNLIQHLPYLQGIAGHSSTTLTILSRNAESVKLCF